MSSVLFDENKKKTDFSKNQFFEEWQNAKKECEELRNALKNEQRQTLTLENYMSESITNRANNPNNGLLTPVDKYENTIDELLVEMQILRRVSAKLNGYSQFVHHVRNAHINTKENLNQVSLDVCDS